MAVLTTGITITYQSGFLAEVLDFSWDGMSREKIKTSHMGTVGAHTYMPSSLYEPGEIEVEIAFDPEQDPTAPLAAAAESVTVTYADAVPASTMAASGFMTGFTITGPMEDRMTARATLALSGTITHG